MKWEEGRRSVLWRGRDSPSIPVGRHLGIEHYRIRTVNHKLKRAWNLRPNDNIIIYENGDVEDDRGQFLGNICDEPEAQCGP